MRKLRELSGDFWRGLGATVVVPGIAALYALGLPAWLLDEAFFGGKWADQAAGGWTAGAALFLDLQPELRPAQERPEGRRGESPQALQDKAPRRGLTYSFAKLKGVETIL